MSISPLGGGAVQQPAPAAAAPALAPRDLVQSGGLSAYEHTWVTVYGFRSQVRPGGLALGPCFYCCRGGAPASASLTSPRLPVPPRPCAPPPQADLPLVLKEFGRYGDIVQFGTFGDVPGANWVHVQVSPRALLGGSVGWVGAGMLPLASDSWNPSLRSTPLLSMPTSMARSVRCCAAGSS